jgi:hypothetical protein
MSLTNQDPFEGEVVESPTRGEHGGIRCDACPVLCLIKPGSTGACDRYTNVDGRLTRIDPLLLTTRPGVDVVRFLDGPDAWDGEWTSHAPAFVTGVGATTTYPDYKPAPFIVGSRWDGVDMVTVVTEGIFSYCGVKVKIDTDRWLGPEQAAVRCEGEQVGHVTTAEYGSQMLALGGVRHLTGGSKTEGRVTCDALLRLCNREAVEVTIDGGSKVVVQAGAPPVVNGTPEVRMRVGCGSATIGIFAQQWVGLADEVIVVDDHITGMLSEHQAGRFLDMRPTGIRLRGKRSTPGRYFRVANPGLGWGGTDITDPLSIIARVDRDLAWPGLRLLFVSTTGEHAQWFVLDESLTPVEQEMPPAVRAVCDRIAENCEPALCSVLFMGGAGGSLRAGVTQNPVLLTRSTKAAVPGGPTMGRLPVEASAAGAPTAGAPTAGACSAGASSAAARLTRVTCGGAPVYLWPGGGITLMVDVLQMPERSFGYVPTPALVAPIEFTLTREDYARIGGHVERVVRLEEVLRKHPARTLAHREGTPWPLEPLLPSVRRSNGES